MKRLLRNIIIIIRAKTRAHRMVITIPLMVWLVIVSTTFCYGQKENSVVTGTIINYANQPLYLYQCGVYPYKGGRDTLLFVDSTITNKKGEFVFTTVNFSKIQNFEKSDKAMFKVVLKQKQFFYILNDGSLVEIKTIYQPDIFYNIATDSLNVLKSEENKRFYEFQNKQQQINVANYFLLQMMRLYPLPDPFHKQIEDEYLKRYAAMEQFVKKSSNEQSPASLIAKAYYQPVLPDWKQPDPWRDSIIALHYFDYFNPADSFYLHTTILPEKIEVYLKLKANKVDAYGQSVRNEMFVATAAQEFLDKTKNNPQNFEFCFNYLLKKFNKEHNDNSFLYIYDYYLKNEQQSCEPSTNRFNWVREKINVLKGIQIGSVAPDFDISDNLQLSNIQSDYTLLLFWATWCPHCVDEVPKIRDVVNNFNSEFSSKGKLITIAVSLDTDTEQWQKFVTKNNLLSFLNISELKGWKSESVKRFNVYATPTMFLLDKNKKIIAKPETEKELIKSLLGHK